MSIAAKYKLLSDVEHVLRRPGRYVGSAKPHTEECYVLGADKQMVRREVTWVPALLKIFDEIISNPVDFSKTPEGKHLNQIDVTIDRMSGEISILDNGGIPVEIHPEHNLYVPSLIFGHLRAGSNFDDTVDSTGTGQNGEGATLTNIFSTSFEVDTSDRKKRFKQRWSDNSQTKSEPEITAHKSGFTRITFTPDYERLGCSLDDDNYAKLVKRVHDIAGTNPKLNVKLNGEVINYKSFKDYVAIFCDDFVYDDNGSWQVAAAKSEDGFQHVSFVNTTETSKGGNHIYYVAYQIANRMRDYIESKHKVKVKPTEVLAQMRLFINASIVRPRYDSQTKENLITEVGEFKTAWSLDDKFFNELIKSEVVQRVLDWAAAKQKAMESAELRKMNKDSDKTSIRKILKLVDANLAGKKPEDCMLVLTEGDAAKGACQSARDAKTMGVLALRGVPLNVSACETSRIAKNEEFFNIMTAMGLRIGKRVEKISDLRYGKLVIMTDADHDGAGHITGLLINNFHRFWPELFELGVMHRFVTPLVKVTIKGQKAPINFETTEDFKAWQAANPKVQYSSKYFKGLATNTIEEFKTYMANIDKHLVKLDLDDNGPAMIELAFGKTAGSANARKAWLGIQA